MKKIFGIFIIGAVGLSLASCEEEDPNAELAAQFKTAFSNDNLNSIESLPNGTYAYTTNEYSDASEYDDTTYLNSTVAKIYVSGDTTKVELSMTETTQNVVSNVEDKSISNLLVKSVNDEITSAYFGADYSSKENGTLISSHTYIDEFLNENLYLYDGLTLSDAINYDYVSLTVDGTSITSEMLMEDLLGSTYYNVDQGLGSDFSFELSDFLVDDFTTYETISSTQAYANIEFKLFDGQGADVTRNMLADTFGLEADDESINMIMGIYQALLPNASMHIKLGINPTTGGVNYLKMDMAPFYASLGLNDYTDAEFAFISSDADMSLPNNRVLDGNIAYIENNRIEEDVIA